MEIKRTIIEHYNDRATGYVSRLSWLGKEKDKESELGDHGVRKYNSTAGRFMSVDPLWEKYLSWSPYQYSGNNPVNAVDVDGRKIEWDPTLKSSEINMIKKLYSMTETLRNDYKSMEVHSNTVLMTKPGSDKIKGKGKGITENASFTGATKGDHSNMSDGDGTNVFIAFNFKCFQKLLNINKNNIKAIASHVGHESDHAIRGINGLMNEGIQSEFDAMGHENFIRLELGIPLLDKYNDGRNEIKIPLGPMIPIPEIIITPYKRK